MTEPIVALPGEPASADGSSFSMHEWRGSGPAQPHIHHSDDEAWHVLQGTLTFQFGDRVQEVGAGGTVFVPAGTLHTFDASPEARYLIVLTPRLRALIEELHSAPPSSHAEIYRKYESQLIE
jgi:quercetin dioxygenase-like cupin family protein